MNSQESNTTKVTKNAGWIISMKIIQSLVSLIVGMLVVRYWGPSKYGTLTYASSLVAFIIPIMNLGISNILVQEIINYPKNEGEILGTAITLSFFSSIFCIVIIYIFTSIANKNDSTTIIVCLLYSINLIFRAFNLILYWFQAKYLSRITSIISFFAYCLVALYKIVLLIQLKTIYWFAVSSAFDYAIIAFFSYIYYRRNNGKRLSFSIKTAKVLFRKSKYYIVASMMVTIFAQTDKVMLKLMINEEATGYYGAAAASASMLGFVFSAIIDSFRPSIFEGKRINNSVFEYRETLLYSVIIYASLIVSIFMTATSKYIIKILYGKDFIESIRALQIIVWYTIFSYIGSVRNIWILANSLQKYLWIINFSGASINVLLNCLFIPAFGICGAASASLITQIFTNVIIGYIIPPIRHNNAIMLNALRPQYIITVTKKIISLTFSRFHQTD